MNVNYSNPLQAADNNTTPLSHDTLRRITFKEDFSVEDYIHLRKLKKGWAFSAIVTDSYKIITAQLTKCKSWVYQRN